MKPTGRCLSLLVVLVMVGGCVKKSEYEALQGQLAESKERADEYEGLYQGVMEERSVALQEAAEYLPAAATELREQLDLRLEEVTRDLDTQIREDVQDTLDELTDAMAEGYQQLRGQNAQLQGQLTESRNLLERLMDRTGSIERTVGTDRVALLGKRDLVMQRIEELTSEVNDWKYKHVDCRDCPEKLRLNKREREAIAQIQLHTVASLEELRNEFVLMAGELESALQEGDAEEPSG